MNWTKTPQWNGKEIPNFTLDGKLLCMIDSQPFMVQVEHCDDYFVPVFSDREKLDEAMNYFVGRGFAPPSFSIKQVEEGTEFLESLKEGGVRCMVDPSIINEHHTKWIEPIKENEKWGYYMQEQN